MPWFQNSRRVLFMLVEYSTACTDECKQYRPANHEKRQARRPKNPVRRVEDSAP